MAAPIATREPTEIQAGNTLEFTKSFGDYPAPTWSLSYSLRKRDGQAAIDFSATTSGTGFSVTVTAATTALWASGDYILVGYVTSGTDRYEVYRGRLAVTPDIAESTAIDPRGFFERTRDKLRTMIEGSDADGIGGIVRDILRYGYNGTNTEVVSMKDAFDALAWLDNRVRQEQNKGRQQRILTRFRCPT